jgi:hypothetical protein
MVVLASAAGKVTAGDCWSPLGKDQLRNPEGARTTLTQIRGIREEASHLPLELSAHLAIHHTEMFYDGLRSGHVSLELGRCDKSVQLVLRTSDEHEATEIAAVGLEKNWFEALNLPCCICLVRRASSS